MLRSAAQEFFEDVLAFSRKIELLETSRKKKMKFYEIFLLVKVLQRKGKSVISISLRFTSEFA